MPSSFWIDLNAWVALSTRSENCRLLEISQRLEADLSGDADPEIAVVERSTATKSAKMEYTERAATAALLFLESLMPDYDSDHEDDTSDIKGDDSSGFIIPEDFLLENLRVKVPCPLTDESLDVCEHVHTFVFDNDEGIRVNGVKIDQYKLSAMIKSIADIRFKPCMKRTKVNIGYLLRSQHQFFRQLGLLFYQFFSRGQIFQDPEGHEDRTSSSSPSEHIKRLKLNLDQELLLHCVPQALCTFVTDLISSGRKLNDESPFKTFNDIVDELNEIIYERPSTLLHEADTGDHETLDFGNRVFGRDDIVINIVQLATLERNPLSNRLFLISGNPGEGKSYLIENVKSHLNLLQSGWLHVGIKFDRLMQNSPLSAISSAFQNFFVTIMGRQNEEVYLTHIAELLETHLPAPSIVLLCGLVPCLRRLFPSTLQRVVSDEDLRNLSNMENREEGYDIASDALSSRNRLHILFRLLVHAISSFGRPLFFVMDDLQWADNASMDLVSSLLMEFDHLEQLDDDFNLSRVAFAGLYRSDEVNTTHILSSYIERFNASVAVDVFSFDLVAVTKKTCNLMISYGLRLPSRLTSSLADVIHSKTVGNMFHIKSFLTSLVNAKILCYDMNVRRWVWDLKVIKKTSINENVAQLLMRNIRLLPMNTIFALQLISCFGATVDDATLGHLSNYNVVILGLEAAVAANIVEKHGPAFKFAHDILHQGIYDSMGGRAQGENHYMIGREIINHFSCESTESQFQPLTFVAIDQINRAKMLGVSDRASFTIYAKLNLKAAERSMNVSNFGSSLHYAENGILFLTEDRWEESKYKLSLRLHEIASKSCSATAQTGKLRPLLDEIFDHAQCLEDKLPSHYIMIESLGAGGEREEAIDKSFAVLGELGESFPDEVSSTYSLSELVATKNLLMPYCEDDVIAAPRIGNGVISATMRLMGSLLTFLFSSRPSYYPLVACRIIHLSIEHGFCSDSAFGLMAFANSVWINLKDIDEAYHWGKISIALHKTFKSNDTHPKLKCQFYFSLVPFREPLYATALVLRDIHYEASIVGDPFYACTAFFAYVRFGVLCGVNLHAIEKECIVFVTKMARMKEMMVHYKLVSTCLMIYELSGKATTQFEIIFDGLKSRDSEIISQLAEGDVSGPVQVEYFQDLFRSFWFKRYYDAAKWADKYRRRNMVRFLDVNHTFYEGLTAFQIARTSSVEPNWMELGKRSISSFEEWVKHSAWNFENKLNLLQAELYFTMGEKDTAIAKYQESIKSAREHRFLHEEGLALELLGQLHLRHEESDIAKSLFMDSQKCYEDWGAFGIIGIRIPEEFRAASTGLDNTNETT